MLVPLTRHASVSCISLEDPAVDLENAEKKPLKDAEGNVVAEAVPRYLTERLKAPESWRDTVPMKEGTAPTVFVIGVVPPAELNRIEDECAKLGGERRTKELMWRAFLHGIRDVEGMGIEVIYTDVGGVKYASPQWLADVFCGPLRKVALEIGTIVYNWNEVSAADVGN